MGLAGWRDLAIVLLAIEALVIVLVVGIIFFALNRGMAKLLEVAKTASRFVQERLQQVAAISEQISLKVTAPVIGAEAATAKVRRWATVFRATSSHRRSV